MQKDKAEHNKAKANAASANRNRVCNGDVTADIRPVSWIVSKKSRALEVLK